MPNLKQLNAKFIKSIPKYSESEDINLPQFAFIGRSNVGKSTLINTITGSKGLAKTSSKPGKTKLINYFKVDEDFLLIDLPGYGYASVSKKDRIKWIQNTKDYLINSPNLYCLFILLDSRIDIQKIDMDFINWAGEQSIPIILILTKSDKTKSVQLKYFKKELESQLLKSWESTPDIIVTSSISNSGIKDLHLKILEIMNF